MTRGEVILASTNQNVIGQILPEVLKSRSRRGVIAIVYIMVDYK